VTYWLLKMGVPSGGPTDGLAAARGGGGVVSMSQATWQMLELAIRRTSNPSDAPPGQDSFGVSLSAGPGGGSSGRGEPAGGAEMPLVERRGCRASWVGKDGSFGGVPGGEEGGGDARPHVFAGDSLVHLRSVPDASGESLVPLVRETVHTSIGGSERRLGPRLSSRQGPDTDSRCRGRRRPIRSTP